MNWKNYLPIEEKPPEEISWGPIASQYQVATTPSFIPSSSLQEVHLILAWHLVSMSTTRLVVAIVCYPDVTLVPCPKKLNKAAKVFSPTSSPPPVHPFIVVYFTAATVTTATTSSLPRLVARLCTVFLSPQVQWISSQLPQCHPCPLLLPLACLLAPSPLTWLLPSN